MREAIRTLAALPDRERRFIYAKQASWPETLRDPLEVWINAIEAVRKGTGGPAFEALRPGRPIPSGEEIDRMDEALDWLTWLDHRELRIVTLRAFDFSWVTIGDRCSRVSRTTAERWHGAAVKKIHGHLRRGDSIEIKPRAADAALRQRRLVRKPRGQ